MLAVAIFASIVVVAHWAEPTQEALDTGMYYQDTTWYHMSFSGRFAQTGEVGPLHLTDPLKLTAWYYPQNSELLHAIPMVALDNDFFSPLINLGWLAVALLAAFCIGRPYAVGAATLLGAAVVLDSEMLVGSQAGNAPNDIAGIFFLLCVIAFLVNGAATARAAPRIAGAVRATRRSPRTAGRASTPRPTRSTLRRGWSPTSPWRETPACSPASAPAPCCSPGSRRASASGPRSPCWRRSGS